ncbi:glycosyltransferase [Sphingomonas hylomeconis]|uniref:glycosyltransferase n=1 Tax=Sphingomonas hylomeconis TaxID=1395958 RepID=UPI0021BB535D|nr:glycosyltransferase family 2 protein [Sphingomonas hylomeconis]
MQLTPITVAICVPVRNEALLLPRLLEAIAAQAQADALTLRLFFDDCRDDSADIVAQHAASMPFRIVSKTGGATAEPNAGRARAQAMTIGLDACGDAAVLLSTDADSIPAPDWVARNLAALDLADLVCGRIVRGGELPSAIQDRVEAYYDGLFALRRAIDPVPWEAPHTHHYTSGASLAVRAGTYRALGGFEPRASAEDARFVDAAHAAGLRVRRDAAVCVETSSRRHGRAAAGLADHLRGLDGGATGPTMAHPADEAWRYRGQARARAAWGDAAAVDRLAVALGRDAAHIRAVARTSANAEAFAMRVIGEVPGGARLATLDEAERALANLTFERSAAA